RRGYLRLDRRWIARPLGRRVVRIDEWREDAPRTVPSMTGVSERSDGGTPHPELQRGCDVAAPFQDRETQAPCRDLARARKALAGFSDATGVRIASIRRSQLVWLVCTSEYSARDHRQAECRDEQGAA